MPGNNRDCPTKGIAYGGQGKRIAVHIRVIGQKRGRVDGKCSSEAGRKAAVVYSQGRIVDASDGDDHILDAGDRPLRVGGLHLHGDIAGFAQCEVLEVRAGIEAECCARDRGRSLGRAADNGIGQRGAVVLAVEVIAQRCQVDGDGRAILGRRSSCARKCRRIVDASDGDFCRGRGDRADEILHPVAIGDDQILTRAERLICRTAWINS